jgi:hypothetical protein
MPECLLFGIPTDLTTTLEDKEWQIPDIYSIRRFSRKKTSYKDKNLARLSRAVVRWPILTSVNQVCLCLFAQGQRIQSGACLWNHFYRWIQPVLYLHFKGHNAAGKACNQQKKAMYRPA